MAKCITCGKRFYLLETLKLQMKSGPKHTLLCPNCGPIQPTLGTYLGGFFLFFSLAASMLFFSIFKLIMDNVCWLILFTGGMLIYFVWWRLLASYKKSI